MSVRRHITRFVLFCGAAALVVGHSFGFGPRPVFGDPMFVAEEDHLTVTVWHRTHERFALVPMPLSLSDTPPHDDLGENYVRPAWGTFAVVLGVTVCLWASSCNGLVRELIEEITSYLS